MSFPVRGRSDSGPFAAWHRSVENPIERKHHLDGTQRTSLHTGPLCVDRRAAYRLQGKVPRSLRPRERCIRMGTSFFLKLCRRIDQIHPDRRHPAGFRFSDCSGADRKIIAVRNVSVYSGDGRWAGCRALRTLCVIPLGFAGRAGDHRFNEYGLFHHTFLQSADRSKHHEIAYRRPESLDLLFGCLFLLKTLLRYHHKGYQTATTVMLTSTFSFWGLRFSFSLPSFNW